MSVGRRSSCVEPGAISGVAFLATHHRQRTRAAEARAASAELQRDRLVRVLALAVHVAAARSETDPVRLLCFLDVAVSYREASEAETDKLARLLRETDPARIGRIAA